MLLDPAPATAVLGHTGVSSGGSSPSPLLIVGPALAVLGVVLVAVLLPRAGGPDGKRRRGWGQGAGSSGVATVIALSGLSLGSGVIHAAVIPAHLEMSSTMGALFAAVAASQVGFAFWVLRRPTGTTWALGTVISLPVLAAWLVSRTVGLPFGPEAGSVEAVGVLDTLPAGFEAVLAANCVLLWRRQASEAVRVVSSG